MMKFVTIYSFTAVDALQLQSKESNKVKICPCCHGKPETIQADPQQTLGLVFNTEENNQDSTRKCSYDQNKTELTVMNLAEDHQECFETITGKELQCVDGQEVITLAEAKDALKKAKSNNKENVELKFFKRGVTNKKLYFKKDDKNHRVCQECYDDKASIIAGSNLDADSNNRICTKKPFYARYPMLSFCGGLVLAAAVVFALPEVLIALGVGIVVVAVTAFFLKVFGIMAVIALMVAAGR